MRSADGPPPRPGVPPPDTELPDAAQAFEDEEEDARIAGLGSLLTDRRKLLTFTAIIVIAIAAIYILIPKIVGLDVALDKLHDATWYWIVAAVGFNVLAFGSYVMLFRGVLGGRTNDPQNDEVRKRLDFSASYQITMAGLAATRIFSAAGAGGIILTYWALRKAGMPRRRSACRMVAFLVLTYSVYMLALVLFGILLRTGVLPGEAPTGGTTVPAAIGGSLLLFLLLVALIPGNLERRLSRYTGEGRWSKLAQRLATVPATLAMGVRTALDYIRHPRSGALAVGGAIGFWAAQIGILWASFEAFGGDVSFGVLVQGFFIGHGGEPDPVARRRGGFRRRGDDRGVRPVRHPERRRLPGCAHIPGDRLLAPDPAWDRRLLPFAPHRGPLGSRSGGSILHKVK